MTKAARNHLLHDDDDAGSTVVRTLRILTWGKGENCVPSSIPHLRLKRQLNELGAHCKPIKGKAKELCWSRQEQGVANVGDLLIVNMARSLRRRQAETMQGDTYMPNGEQKHQEVRMTAAWYKREWGGDILV
jgi:hypothetical protein